MRILSLLSKLTQTITNFLVKMHSRKATAPIVVAATPAPQAVEPPQGPKQIEIVDQYDILINGKLVPTPTTIGDLPDPLVFILMFERKFGVGGTCTLSIEGTNKQFDCDSLYILLRGIKLSASQNALYTAVYGSVLNVILHAHGETPVQAELN